MKKTFIKNTVLAVGFFVGMTTAALAQGVFQTIHPEQVCYFKIDAATGQFQIDSVAFPTTLPDNVSALITTPAGALTFSIGVGTPHGWDNSEGNMFPNPFIPLPPPQIGSGLNMMGVQFNGTFQSSPDVYADLLAGLGEFEIFSGSTVYSTGSMDVVAVPEPGSFALSLCGLMSIVWIKSRGFVKLTSLTRLDEKAEACRKRWVKFSAYENKNYSVCCFHFHARCCQRVHPRPGSR